MILCVVTLLVPNKDFMYPLSPVSKI